MHHVDPSKTIQVPYSQGDVAVFEQNAGQRVTMSLCALVYHNTKGIGNPDDLKQIMLLEVNYIAVCHYYQDNHFYC